MSGTRTQTTNGMKPGKKCSHGHISPMNFSLEKHSYKVQVQKACCYWFSIRIHKKKTKNTYEITTSQNSCVSHEIGLCTQYKQIKSYHVLVWINKDVMVRVSWYLVKKQNKKKHNKQITSFSRMHHLKTACTSFLLYIFPKVYWSFILKLSLASQAVQSSSFPLCLLLKTQHKSHSIRKPTQ